MSKVIGLDIDGVVEWHAVNGIAGADYSTMCGVDADDPCIGHNGTVQAPRGQKINCSQCYQLWKGVTEMRLRESNFSIGEGADYHG